MRPSDNVLTEPVRVIAELDTAELAFELGVWLMGARSFETVCNTSFDGDAHAAERDRKREIRILHEVLVRCIDLVFKFSASVARPRSDPAIAVRFRTRDLDDLAGDLRRAILLCESMSRSEAAGTAEWAALNSGIKNGIAKSRAVERLDMVTSEFGRSALPPRLLKILNSPTVELSDRFDLDDVVPRIGVILKSLNLVGTMLLLDEPIKPALAVFAAVFEQVQEFVAHINGRLSRFPNEDAAMFSSLDSASYTLSLELKKVFRHELSGIVGVVPPTAVYAKVEAAHALLVDSFQQILADLARMIDGSFSAVDYFPALQLKLDQSLMLRDHLWQILKAVKGAEQKPEDKAVNTLKQELSDFGGLTIRYLHYKDEETFERFSEEVNAARDKKDLVPILHRFGAYLETLFGQVSMRNVLAGHPFEQNA